MPKVRNITIAVSPELYRQTRHIAAEMNSNVTELVRQILIHLPNLLKRINHPAADWAGIKRPSPPTAPAPSTAPAPAATPIPTPSTVSASSKVSAPAATPIPAPTPNPVASAPSAIPASQPPAREPASRRQPIRASAMRSAPQARTRAALLRQAERLLRS